MSEMGGDEACMYGRWSRRPCWESDVQVRYPDPDRCAGGVYGDDHAEASIGWGAESDCWEETVWNGGRREF